MPTPEERKKQREKQRKQQIEESRERSRERQAQARARGRSRLKISQAREERGGEGGFAQRNPEVLAAIARDDPNLPLILEEARAKDAELKAAEERRPEEREQMARQEEFMEQAPEIMEERRIGEQPTQERIIPPEQENLGVMTRIAKGMIPENLKTVVDFFSLEKQLERQETMTQAEITTVENDLKQGVEMATAQEIDSRIEGTEKVLMENGIPVIGVVGTTLIAQAVISPTSEFIGTDGQISSLETALSQYNEMTTIPARSVQSGALSPEEAFDRIDRMEEGILALEQQLRISAQESTKVALALRGRAIEARLLKLKTKLQESREKVFAAQAAEAFGEKEVADSVAFLRRLQNEKKQTEQQD